MKRILTCLIFLLLFNLFFFTLGGTGHNASTWWSYAFIHLAYAGIIALPLLGSCAPGLTLLTASLYIPALLYFFSELVLGCLWMILAPADATWPLLSQALLLGVFLFVLLAMLRANDATVAALGKQQAESLFIRELVLQLRPRLRALGEPAQRKCVERCYDALNVCSLESFPQAQESEQALQAAVAALCEAIDAGAGDLSPQARRVLDAIDARNAAIRLCRQG